jgi:hypothetical protein
MGLRLYVSRVRRVVVQFFVDVVGWIVVDGGGFALKWGGVSWVCFDG